MSGKVVKITGLLMMISLLLLGYQIYRYYYFPKENKDSEIQEIKEKNKNIEKEIEEKEQEKQSLEKEKAWKMEVYKTWEKEVK